MNDGITKISLLRNLYRAEGRVSSGNEEVRELKEIKSELKISNDLKAIEIDSKALTSSPYYTDQSYYNPERIYNTSRETDWKEVRSQEENHRAALVFRNMKRLNIL